MYGSTKNKIYDNEVSSNYYDGIGISTNSDSNNIHDNRIEDNGKYGVYFSSDSNNNIFSKNVVCSNPTDIHDEDKNSGDDNTCNTMHNWNDDGTHGCTYSCPAEKPDLIITDVWNEDGTICYQIRNIGNATAQKGHYTALSINGEPRVNDLVDVELGPKERLNRCFNYQWECTSLKDTLEICADREDFIAESNEKNNCRVETWKCDTTPPRIIKGPTLSEITQTSAIVSWTTDEDSDSVVKFDRRAGKYEYQKSDTKLSKGHQITLTDLKPSTTYHYVVESTDASDNTVGSKEGYFQTEPLPDSINPNVTFFALTKRSLPPEFTVLATDNVGVDRVEFYYDGEYVETDYSTPYQFCLDPAYMGITRAEYFTDHTIDARAFDRSGMVSVETTAFLPYCGCDPPAEWFFKMPYEGYMVSTNGDVAEEGTIIDIVVEASTTEWTYGHVSGHPDIETMQGTAVDRMEFWVDGTRVYNSTANTTYHSYDWDASGISLGEHTVVVKAYYHEGCPWTERHTFRVVRPMPDINISRMVERVGNYLTVTVFIENEAEDISEVAIIDNFTHHSTIYGFQTIDKVRPDYTVTSSYLTHSRGCENEITLDTPYRIYPGEEMEIQYLAVPIIYKGTAFYKLGGTTTEIDYRDAYDNPYHETFTHPEVWGVGGSRFARVVDDATRGSDYLIVTNPYNLLGLYDEVEANAVLDKMAELAMLQNGVLGYFNGYHTLETSFEEGDQIALTGGHISGRSGDDEIIIADYGDDLIRVYDANEELLIETGSQLPIAHSLDGGDVIAVGNACDEDAGGTAHDRAEIVVADSETGRVTVYQHNYNPRSDEFTSFDFDTRYGEGDGFAVGNVELLGTEYWQEEIIVANICDNPSVCTGEIDFHRNRVSTPSKTFRCPFRTGDKLAVGRLLDSDRERIIISHTDSDTIDIYNWVGSEPYLQLEYSISHTLATEDVLTVGDLWGNAGEEIVLADKDRDRIFVYSYQSITDSMIQVRNIDYFLQPEDSVAVADIFEGGKEEILVTRGRTSGGHHEGDVEILSVIFGETPGDRYALDDLMNEGGEWAERMRGNWTSEGYLLLVGEIEIIPTFSASWYLYWEGRRYVRQTDRNYASTAGDSNYPELSVGRIIGDSAALLKEPIQTSIDIATGVYDFDNSHAYAVSGPDGDPRIVSFTEHRDNIASNLRTNDYSVEEEHHPSETEFFSHARGKDVIVLIGHGNWGCWDEIDKYEVRDNFNPGGARPLVFAESCSTGKYTEDTSLAEEFLNQGASAYIGTTSTVYGPWSGRLGENYFSNLEPGRTVGSALKQAKRYRLGVHPYPRDENYNKHTCAAYHLFGDPKLEPTWLSASVAEMASSMSATSVKGALSSIDVSIPDYNVTTRDGEDHVEIPGGNMVLVPGKPLVPSYSVSIDYPKSCQIQDVALTERGGLITDTGLNIPDVIPAIDGGEVLVAQQTAEGSEWWPDTDFDWTIIQNPGDTTTLVIAIYPFYYNRNTTDVRFYKNFTFDINYTTSEVEITALETDKIAYEQGQSVMANAYLLSSPDQPIDVIVDATVKSEDEEIVDGLPLRTLKDVRELASFSVEWISTGFEPGNYVLEVAIRDTSGALLDREMRMFRLGISSGEITNFTATPAYFDIGDDININMAFNNTGTVNITGSAIIKVLNSTGDAVEEFRHNVTDLMPSESIGFDDTWDTSGAEEGAYKILGYVLYDSKATSPATVIVTTVPIEKKPDLEIVKKWENWVDKEKGTYAVSYVVHNSGTTVVPAGHHATLYIDGENVEHKPVPVALKPCDTYEDTFKTVVKCTPPGDKITVCADNYDKVKELDEGNNCMTNVWQCPVSVRKPDLVITDIKLNREGDYCYVDYLISNIETASASASTTYLYVDDKKVASDSTGALAPGASRWDRFTAYRTTGTHSYKVCADGPNAI